MEKGINFSSYLGLGALKFGMTVKEVANVIGPASKTIKMPKDKIKEGRSGIILLYDATGLSEILIYNDGIDFEIGKHKVRSKHDLLMALNQLDSEPYEDMGAIISTKLGLAATGIITDETFSITFFKKGLWDSEIHNMERFDLSKHISKALK